jgi:hypothetical protein
VCGRGMGCLTFDEAGWEALEIDAREIALSNGCLVEVHPTPPHLHRSLPRIAANAPPLDTQTCRQSCVGDTHRHVSTDTLHMSPVMATHAASH